MLVVLAIGLTGIIRLMVRQTRRRQSLVNASFEGIIIAREDRIIEANDAVAALLALVGRSIGTSLDALLPELAQIDPSALAIGMQVDLHPADDDGAPLAVEIGARALDHAGKDARVISIRDVSARVTAQAKLHHFAHHDQLTDLPNRLLFNQRLAAITGPESPRDMVSALVFVDLDGFKAVNDIFGHAAGDAVLVTVAQLMAAQVRASDTVARLGGDEFAILLTHIAGHAQARALAQRLQAQLAEALAGQPGGQLIGLSLGIAMHPVDGSTPELLQRRADAALYRSKHSGKGTYRFFDTSMETESVRRAQLERDLDAALANGDLHLDYQPLARTRSREIIGFEAIVGWNHPQHGPIAVDEVIAAAVNCGAIARLGDWAITTACAEAAGWHNPLKIIVAVAPAQFRMHEVDAVIGAAVDRVGLDPRRLEIKVAETALFRDRAAAFFALERLRARGVTVVLTGFGGSYDALRDDHYLPFDKITIDPSLLESVLARDAAAAIPRAIIGLGRGLGLPVVAEGVETALQASQLRDLNCAEIQGALIGTPQSIAAFAALVGMRPETRRVA